jgi:hypothetical protein
MAVIVVQIIIQIKYKVIKDLCENAWRSQISFVYLHIIKKAIIL